ncbi:MAG TPA: SNF2-related protein, partial [Bacteroidales bacterium]|nr:SNF2-related protein [Bacteroidales bacterium]
MCSSGEYCLVFAIVENPVLGLLLEPYAVKQLARNQFSYEYHRVGLITVSDFFPNLTPVQKKLLEIHAKYSDEAILKRFNKDKLKPVEFFQSLSQEFVVSWIRPIIDKNMAEMAAILAGQNVPVHFKGGRTDRIREEPINVLTGKAETVFCFTWLSEGLFYKLNVKYNEKEISLKSGNTRLLAQKPCLLILDDHLYQFEKEWDGKKLVPFFTREHIQVPKSSEKEYFRKFVYEAVRKYSVIAEGFSVEVISDLPRALVSLEQNWQNHWVLLVSFDYGKVVFQLGDETPSKVFLNEENEGYSFSKVVRQTSFEKQFIKKLEETGLKYRGGDGFYLWYPARNGDGNSEPSLPGYFDYLDWLSAQSLQLGLSHITVQKNEGAEKFLPAKPSLRIAVNDKNDWFDLFGTVSFGKFEIPFLKLKNHILNGRREFSLPDGSIGLIPEEWLSKYQDILKYSVNKGNTLQLKKHHYTLLNNLNEATYASGEPTKVLHDFVPPSLPAGIKATLRPYQVQGYQWMCFLFENKLGGCLADDMGLGKTLQTLAMLMFAHKEVSLVSNNAANLISNKNNISAGQLKIFAEEDHNLYTNTAGTSLLIMPLSLIHNWVLEINRFAPSFKILQHTGTARADSTRLFSQFDLILTTYGT